MIEFDVDIRIEKMLIKILKNKTKKFLKYIEDNNINIEDEEELIKAAEEFEEKEKKNKTIYGLNKMLLLYTLTSISNKIGKTSKERFKNRMTSEMFEEVTEKADKQTEELYKNTLKRAIYYITKHISNVRKIHSEILKKSSELSIEELKKEIKTSYYESFKKLPEHIEKYIEKIRAEKSKFKMEEFEKRVQKDIAGNIWEEAKERVEEQMTYSDVLNTNSVLGETQAEYVKIIMEELGINSFVWITKHDSRVRAKHSWRDGKVFDMNGNLLKGSGEDTDKILPKQEWGCRCKMGVDEKTIEEVLESA